MSKSGWILYRFHSYYARVTFKFRYIDKTKNPTILTTHCIIYRQALTSKTLPKELYFGMKIPIELVNAFKNSALNTRVFQILCPNINSEHETLLFHTETRWL